MLLKTRPGTGFLSLTLPILHLMIHDDVCHAPGFLPASHPPTWAGYPCGQPPSLALATPTLASLSPPPPPAAAGRKRTEQQK
jgi:hypothetical protein